MNRTSFITLHKNRLFTAEQVCDIVEEESGALETKQAYRNGYEDGFDEGRTAAKTKALEATDDCWRRMHHGANVHHHGMKRDLFLRFRRAIESLQTKGGVE